jgi:disulfide oxidoreductase YuzD
MVFVCLDNHVEPYQEALLQRSYMNSTFFQLNYEKIFNHLQRKKSKNIVEDKLLNFYPLLLHVNSTGSGLLFNYFYSYLNRQISSSNN